MFLEDPSQPSFFVLARRLPHIWQPQFLLTSKQGGLWKDVFPKVKAPVIPVLVRPDETYVLSLPAFILH